MDKWKQVSSDIRCENRWIRVREDVVLLPTNQVLDSYIVVEYIGAVGIVAINRNNELLMVEQYRYPLEQFTWEIPSGAVIRDEDISVSALRELREETGYSANSIEYLGKHHPSPGSSNEIIHIVTAAELYPDVELVESNRLLQHKWIPLYGQHGVISQIRAGHITHGPTIVGLFLSLAELHTANPLTFRT
jgi:ADP-ribose pyrophosphatase